jgi:hypothetical protein
MVKPLSQINQNKELRELSLKALSEIRGMRHPLIQFCGPISTGGFGNAEDNIFVFKEIINGAKKAGISVFDQMKYERLFDKILKNHKGYDFPLLENFYNPIISSGLVDALFFIPLWETSQGSKWEFDLATREGVKTVILNDLMLNSIIDEYNKLL